MKRQAIALPAFLLLASCAARGGDRSKDDASVTAHATQAASLAAPPAPPRLAAILERRQAVLQDLEGGGPGPSGAALPPVVPPGIAGKLEPIEVDPATGRPGGLRAELPSNVAPRALIQATLPSLASGVLRLEDARDHRMALAVTLEGALPVQAVTHAGLAFYEGAGPDGADVVQRVDEDGVEDFFSMDARPSREALRYHVGLRGVSGLRLVENVLEFLDDEARPRIRINRPSAVGADGNRHMGRLAVEGCAVDTSPLPPVHRAFTRVSGSSCDVIVTWGDAAGDPVPYPAILDPAWTSGATMNTARADFAVTPFYLVNEMLLVTGGYATTGLTPLATAEILDESGGGWVYTTTSMVTARRYHRSSVLSPTGAKYGDVLVTGGIESSGSTTVYATVERWSPATGLWATPAPPPMSVGHAYHTQYTLKDGRIFVAGGYSSGSSKGPATTVAELFDPVKGTWSLAAAEPVARANAASSVLLDGRVLIGTGNSNAFADPFVYLSSCEIYDPVSDSWTTNTPSASAIRNRARMTTLTSGKALLTGGLGTGSVILNTSEVYDPVANTWSPPKAMVAARARHIMEALNDGQALVAGGEATVGGAGLASAELYDPTLDQWTSTVSMTTARTRHLWHKDPVGTVWVLGGLNTTTTITATVEKFSSQGAIGAPCSGASACTSGFCVDGVCCDRACGGTCEACSAAVKGQGTNGTCGFVVAGKDDKNSCTAQAPSTCGADGFCDGAGACRLYPVGTTCRAAAAECDTAETCPGNGAACPADAKVPVNTACPSGADTNPCTLDVCDGASSTCQHPAGNAGAICRAAAGACDLDESCTGTSTSCPVDSRRPNTYVCRTSSGECDPAESCDGTGVACPANALLPANTQCPSGIDSNVCTLDICDGSAVTCQHPAGNGGTVCRSAAGDCDVAEKCTGTTTTCPSDTKVAANTPCPSGADSNVCTQDVCDGASITCQHPAGNAGAVCRASVGPCDADDTCTGTSSTCPADAKQPITYACRPAATGGCDVAEYCDGTTNGCPIDGFQPSTYQCRAASCTVDVATLAANCTGSSALCPSAQTQSCSPATCSGTVCGGCSSDAQCTSTQYCSSGVCVDRKPLGAACSGDNQCALAHCADGVCCNTACSAGVCDSCTQPNLVGTCSPVAAATVCRPAVDACDAPETCGGATTCPADAKKVSGAACPDDGNACTTDLCDGTSVQCQHAPGNAGTQCRPSNGTACDLPDSCDGISATCADTKRPSTYVCRASAGECDVDDKCDGVTDACPVDAHKPSGATCTDDGNVCTTDLCDGASPSCQHAPGNAGTACRPANGPCDLADTCSGTSSACTDAKRATSYVCRLAAGECDKADTCDGVSDSCPTDAKLVSGTACTDDGNPCTADTCSGSSDLCQHGAGNPGAVCRAATGACDAAETCTGTSSLCPADAKQPNTSVCRPASGVCDQADTCDGVSNTCPADAYLPSGSLCQAGSCAAGVVTLPSACTGSSASCPPPVTQTCPTGCSGTTCANPCTNDVDCAPPAAPDGGAYPDAGPGGYCSAAGVCTPRIAQGGACLRDGECGTGHCADGFCCDTVCSAGVCDSCAIVKGTCTAVAPTTICRPSTGECDVEETCGGAKVCPADTTRDGQACATDGEVCTSDVCAGKVCTHPAAPAVTICRAAGSECDVEETCGGASTCPPDARKADGAACTDDGSPCSSDVCQAGTCQHPAGNQGVVCRAAAGECDFAESCDGVSPACPTDLYVANATPCTSDSNVCTVDACQSGVCAHAPGNKGFPCRVASGECDVLEYCDGVSTSCPVDGFKTDGTSCTADTNPCTSDVCRSGACAHPAGNAGARCRAAASICDATETCSGSSPDCPPDAYLVDGTSCLDDGKPCTIDACAAGVCSHVSADGAACTDGNGCTTPDTCNAGVCSGTPVASCTCTVNADCDDGNVCNGAETCASGACKAGTLLDCDDFNTCTADGCDPSAGCLHSNLGDGAPCSDGNYCTVGDTCLGGTCLAGGARVCTATNPGPCEYSACDSAGAKCGLAAKPAGTSCNDGNACTQNDSCLSTSCTGQFIAGCKACTTLADCDDGNGCTTDACDAALGTCTHAAIPGCLDSGRTDAGSATDSGVRDGGAGGSSEASAGGAAGASGSDGGPAGGTAGGGGTTGAGGGGPDASTNVDASAGGGAKHSAGERSPLGCRCETVGVRASETPWTAALGALAALVTLRSRRRRTAGKPGQSMTHV